MNTEYYYRLSTDVVTSSPVQSTTGFTYVYFNAADIMNNGVEVTVNGKLTPEKGLDPGGGGQLRLQLQQGSEI